MGLEAEGCFLATGASTLLALLLLGKRSITGAGGVELHAIRLMTKHKIARCCVLRIVIIGRLIKAQILQLLV